MFCPRCATQNADEASFCRGCGSNISLVPKALTGQIAAAIEKPEELEGLSKHERRRRRREQREKQPVSVEQAIKNIFVGFAFLLIFICGALFMRGRFFMWFWSVIPALALIGDGVGKYIRYTHEQRGLASATSTPAATRLAAPPRVGALPDAASSDEFMVPPPSVTETTTRHLETSKRANT